MRFPGLGRESGRAAVRDDLETGGVCMSTATEVPATPSVHPLTNGQQSAGERRRGHPKKPLEETPCRVLPSRAAPSWPARSVPA
ncbi:hypothetical protein QO012_003272 [Methylobacterium aerolatum]|uniref:Uncharacterized protein n=1 Tax=Methylobacterium aerolatum TaxID=418708 RepID=A0ABU0I2D6_9HYPH|nr:hypothetical protein [Methylobacterium aerolatum]GJD34032.1 hypothetical protein FMGBMHLM_0928 [Methylobacterium aerolatum]